MGENIKFSADITGEPVRLDRYLAEKYPELSRSRIQQLIADKQILINGKNIKASFKLAGGEEVDLTLPDPEPCDIKAVDIPLDILYEDDDVLIINKPKNMVVHPSSGHTEDTLVNGILFHCHDNLSGINGIMRPGIVHRIDKNTTGSLIICKNDHAHQFLADKLKVHDITRVYRGIVIGHLKEESGTVSLPIGRDKKDRKKMAVVKEGKNAITNYTVLEELKDKYSYIECRLETGRTHQIRVHMAYIGHPLLGDAVYGHEDKKFNLTGQTLHAKTLGFIHPTTGKYVEFEAKEPEYFLNLLKVLR